jgi:hypothetical protein
MPQTSLTEVHEGAVENQLGRAAQLTAESQLTDAGTLTEMNFQVAGPRNPLKNIP